MKKLKRKQNTRLDKTSKIHGGIVVKLIASFMIPVCFVIIIGVVSYYKSSKAIVNGYLKYLCGFTTDRSRIYICK